MIDNAKSKYLHNRLSSITSSARLWFELSSLGLAKPRISSQYPEVSLNQLNTFFTTVHLSSPTTLRHNSLLSPPSPPSFPLPVPEPFTFYFSNITPAILRSALLKCTTNSTGPDGINR